MAAKPKTAFKYVGQGEHYYAIPARDLTDEEFAALDASQRRTVEESPHLYEAVEKPKVAAPKVPPPPAP